MEGVAPAPRKGKTAAPRQKKAKPDKSERKNKKHTEEHQGTIFKVEKEEDTDAMAGVEPTVKEEHVVKPEPMIKTELGEEEDGTWSPDDTVDVGTMQQICLDSAALTYLQPYSPAEESREALPESVAVKAEPVVKMEPLWEE